MLVTVRVETRAQTMLAIRHKVYNIVVGGNINLRKMYFTLTVTLVMMGVDRTPSLLDIPGKINCTQYISQIL